MSTAAPIYTQCASLPGAGNAANAGCNALITNTNSGISIAVDSKATGFGGEDSFIGVVNNASTPLLSLILTSTTDIFGFDGDSTIGNGTFYGDLTRISFTNINSAGTSGTINFLGGGLAAGATIAFELEENLSAAGLPPPVVGAGGSTGSTVPEPTTVALLGLGLFGFAVSRRKPAK